MKKTGIIFLMLLVTLSLALLSVCAYADNASGTQDERSSFAQSTESSTASVATESKAQSNTQSNTAKATSAPEYDDGVVGRVIFGVCVSLTVILIGAVAIFVLSKLKHKIG